MQLQSNFIELENLKLFYGITSIQINEVWLYLWNQNMKYWINLSYCYLINIMIIITHYEI